MRTALFMALSPLLALQEDLPRSRLEPEPPVRAKPAGWDRAAGDLANITPSRPPADVARAVREVAVWDSAEAAQKLISAYLRTVRQIESFDGQETRLLQKLDETGLRFVSSYMRSPNSRETEGLARQFAAIQKEHGTLVDQIALYEAQLEDILEALGRFRSTEAVQEIVQTSRGSHNLRYRARLIETLGRNRTATALRGILEILTTKPKDIERLAATRALAALGEPAPEVAATLRESLTSEYWQVRVAAAEAAARLGLRNLTEALLESLKDLRGRPAMDLNEALKKLTGVDKRGSYDAWKAWWERHRESFLAGTYRPEPLEQSGSAGTTTFYGIPVISTAVAFVLDVSGSMWQPASWKPSPEDGAPPGLRLAGDLKIHVLQYELKKTLLKLPEGATVCLIFFDSNLHLYG
ncbi:MAG: HEAT repeat domain-containing protein, partial [Planctomycetota bacterium]